jgi:phosphate transport system substrate-binding protein
VTYRKKGTMSVKSTKKMSIALVAALAVVLALVGILASACGGSDETTTSAAPSSTTTAAPSSTDTTAAASITTAAPASTDTTAAAGLSGELNGAGATFPAPLYVEWIGGFQEVNKDVKLNYQGVGSGAGIQQFTKQTVDFGASDAFMKAEEISAAEAARAGAKVEQIPTVFGSIVLAYNLAGSPKLNLDSDVIAKIFLGKITKWNDPALVALNPDTKLPATNIKPVHRSDSSGTTNNFTSYLSAVSPDWKGGPGAGKTVQWPVGIGGQGNDGVAGIIKQNENAIGYIEYTYASQNSMTMAAVKNQAGKFVAPNLDSTSAAAAGIQIPADLNLLPVVMNSASAEAYPIVSPTYILVYDKMADKAPLMKAFLTWALSDDGTAIAKDLGYAPLPADLKAAAQKLVDAIGS